MSLLQVSILTPTGEALKCEAEQITATGLLGEFAILTGHVPFLAALKVGPAYIDTKEQRLYYALGKGFIEVFEDQVTLFVETAEDALDIDEKRAQLALERAQNALKAFADKEITPEVENLQQAIARAQTRLHIAQFKQEYEIVGK